MLSKCRNLSSLVFLINLITKVNLRGNWRFGHLLYSTLLAGSMDVLQSCIITIMEEIVIFRGFLIIMSIYRSVPTNFLNEDYLI